MTTTPQPCSLCARPEADHDDAACSMSDAPPPGAIQSYDVGMWEDPAWLQIAEASRVKA